MNKFGVIKDSTIAKVRNIYVMAHIFFKGYEYYDSNTVSDLFRITKKFIILLNRYNWVCIFFAVGMAFHKNFFTKM